MSDSDNDDIDLVVNQIIMNNIKATEMIKELFDNNLLQDEVGEPSNKRPRGPRKDRGREEEHDKLVADYFAEHPVYNDVDFDRRFLNDLEREVDFFKQHWDARGVKGFSPLQKCASAIRQLAYGSASDAFDEYLRMSETMSSDCLDHFCKGIIYLYMRQYLRKPTATSSDCLDHFNFRYLDFSFWYFPSLENLHEFGDYLRVRVNNTVGRQIDQKAVKPLMGLGQSFTFSSDELLILTYEVNLFRFYESVNTLILDTESIPYFFSCLKLTDGVKYFIRKRHGY
ncbi:hypothetical protein OSB04_001141 [Centaurea solstitialis]|uniref:Uncharacterized protein n=1 Tax=Centaurea solstitialis TaxID=347529 RepID=A0AA38WSH9_9ASTR|nr:hypothetical protein OSB04_001141 [Centaurea solstitialis]